ncbi:hypothetical protein [Blastopirellula retiformator]|uniref:Transaldolase/EF-hand domain-containing protein n=1 Tax=Blastopirellula retiformator TaxID=2527970 RepID=A0A5C5VMU2_9BACT|nr:hypothetical protein [Blastopirellula retiformator]TWT39039.1 transaldolase/EF-hand domain-containing protein [Blastopirellula retiformator]
MLYFRRQLGCVLLTLIALGGCRPSLPHDLPPPANTTIPQIEPEQEEAAVVEPMPDETPVVAEMPAEPVEETPPAKPLQPQKLLVMADRQPLLLDVYLWIDGRPFEEALEVLTEKVLAMADTDGDGVATWEELADNPSFNRGQFGSLSFSNPMERARLIKLYDVNRNGWVDAEETPRLLTRNRGKAREFSVDPRAHASFRHSRETSNTLQVLDRNGDMRLSADEIAAATELLEARDADADGIVSAAELAPPRNAMMGMSGADDWRGEQGAFVLDENTSWPNVLRSIETIYNFGSSVEVAIVFGEDSPLAMVDEDQDGYLEYREIERIADLPPSATIEIRYGARREGEAFYKVSLVDGAQCELQGTEFVESRALVDGTGRLVIHAVDDIEVATEVADGGEESTLAGMRARNALSLNDRDKNNYLDEEEFPPNLAQQLTFAMVDSDEDGQVTLAELQTALTNIDLVKACQIRVQRTAVIDPLFAALDQNGDGRLAVRELRGASQRLAQLDQNGDSRVGFDEFPAFGGLVVYRGGERDGSTMPARVAQASVEGRPDWHQGMDFNGDGDVSWAEFLGNQGQFERLDRDGDGLLSVVEVATESI